MVQRRVLLHAGITAALLPSALPALTRPAAAQPVSGGDPAAFSREWLVEEARRLAGEPFADDRPVAPDAWRDLTYDGYRSIRYRAEAALWRDERLFALEFFHLGFQYDRAVAIHIVRDGQAERLMFSPELYDYGVEVEQPENAAELGFAGFRVQYPLNGVEKLDEFAVFLGASYFRVIGRGQVYGKSARGLAIDTALPGGEEFPVFQAFWIEEPAPDATALVIHALLNSPSATGAYRFLVEPRTSTQVAVDATIFMREAVDKLGIAPITSMFLFGENGPHTFDDFRPEVHDSDGLLVNFASGEWLWRPLVNRQNLNVNSFYATNPAGFGLLQRDRAYASYHDLEAEYHRRPSIWIQPRGDWGSGRIELVEIPSDSEIHDNIVCYWVSDTPTEPGQSISVSYLLQAFGHVVGVPPGGQAVDTRIGTAHRPGATEDTPNGARLFVIEFAHGDLPYLAADQPIEAVVSASSGRIDTAVAQKNVDTDGWRAFFDFVPEGRNPSELRCFLRLRGHALTETWNYLWTG
ncbi:MAG: glucan biosynthesis protein [Rhodospirillaceae bacterium]|nr:glucan biosynthesis protein [Rhodospirillaceae bacterium]